MVEEPVWGWGGLWMEGCPLGVLFPWEEQGTHKPDSSSPQQGAMSCGTATRTHRERWFSEWMEAGSPASIPSQYCYSFYHLYFVTYICNALLSFFMPLWHPLHFKPSLEGGIARSAFLLQFSSPGCDWSYEMRASRLSLLRRTAFSLIKIRYNFGYIWVGSDFRRKIEWSEM